MKKNLILILTTLSFSFNFNAQTLEWVAGILGPNAEEAYSVDVDFNNDIIIVGRFKDSMDVDPGPGTNYLTSDSGYDMYVLKYDVNKNLLWARNVGGISGGAALDVATDQLGNIFITGYFITTVDFDPSSNTENHTTVGGTDAYILALNTNGDFLWAKTFGGTGADRGQAITVDNLGNVYCTGIYKLTADFDPGTSVSNMTSVGKFDVFLLKLDIAGNYIWAKSFGGSLTDKGMGIVTDSNGNIYTTGFFEDTCDFDPNGGVNNLISNGDEDIFVTKLNSLGIYQWSINIGGMNKDRATDIAINSADEIFITGRVVGSVDFDPGINTHFESHLGTYSYVLKLSGSGDYIWSNSIGSGSGTLNQAYSIAVNDNDNIFICGEFAGNLQNNTAAGTVNLNSFGSTDIFVSMIDSVGNFNWIAQMGGSAYEGGYGIATGSNFTYIIGSFSGTVDFDPDTSAFNITEPSDVGAYLVKLNIEIDTIASSDSTGLFVNTTDLSSIISVFPNPSSGTYKLHISQNNSTLTATLRNILGEELFTEELIDNESQTINIEGPSGIYFLYISDNNNRLATFKLIKE
jgi:hypothetical protein